MLQQSRNQVRTAMSISFAPIQKARDQAPCSRADHHCHLQLKTFHKAKCHRDATEIYISSRKSFDRYPGGDLIARASGLLRKLYMKISITNEN
jgi:hypothetical protein